MITIYKYHAYRRLMDCNIKLLSIFIGGNYEMYALCGYAYTPWCFKILC